jgi:hypothetical protein
MNSLKHKRLMTVLHKHNVTSEQRHTLVAAWTDNRTSSTCDLTDKEIDDIVWKLENQSFFAADANAALELELKRKRSVVLTIAQRCGIHGGTDFEQFNNWMVTRSKLKKKLSAYTYDELNELIQQFRKLEANFKASAEKAGTKAWYKKYGIPEAGEQ